MEITRIKIESSKTAETGVVHHDTPKTPHTTIRGYNSDYPEVDIPLAAADVLCISPAPTWGAVQQIKNDVWGRNAVAKEIYPPEDQVSDSGDCVWLQREDGGWVDVRRIGI